MHPNPAFRQEPSDRNLAFARSRGFGILLVNGPEGPLAAHVPFLLNDDASHAELHLARSNPIARAGLPALALLAIVGPDACISPDWYGPHDQVPGQVPTRNDVAVHLRGTVVRLPEDAMPRLMRMILPFRFQVTSVEGTWKLNQNKTPEVRARAAQALPQGNAPAQAIAALIRGLPT